MNIVKASFRNSVRRNWKLALVVFMLGAGLAVLTHAYDGAETIERLQAAAEEMQSEGTEPSGEQLEGMMRNSLMILLFGLWNLPDGAIENLVAGFEAGVAWGWGATGLTFYHFVLWTIIAWLGLYRIEKRPLKL